MVYQIEVRHRGVVDNTYDGIESATPDDAIDRIIKQYYVDYAIEYNGALVVIGYEFTARRLGWWLS